MLYPRFSRLAFPIIIGMVLVSVFYQIEFITQPFIYLVLAASLAFREQDRLACIRSYGRTMSRVS
jgi:hypothetical protein